MSHVISVPDIIWTWAQRQSGNINPSNWLRENVLFPAMIADIGESDKTPEAVKEDRWSEIGMQTNSMDTEFTEARNSFVEQYGGSEEKSIAFFRDLMASGIHSPRAWLMSWWKKQRPHEVKEA